MRGKSGESRVCGKGLKKKGKMGRGLSVGEVILVKRDRKESGQGERGRQV